MQDAIERLRPIGMDCTHDTDAGVIMLVRDASLADTPVVNMLKRKLDQDQKKVLLVLMTLYWGNISIDAAKVISLTRINDSINTYFPEVKPAQRKSALKLFKRCKLIHFSGNVLGEDTEITLHNSLAFCMSNGQLKRIIEDLKIKYDSVASYDDVYRDEFDEGEEETE